MTEHHDPTASHALLQNELKQRGFSVRHYKMADQHYVEYTHPSGNVWLTRIKHFSYPLNHGAIMEMADNKTLAYDWIQQFDVAVAEYITLQPGQEVTRDEAAHMFARHRAWVVKPESGSASHGLTLNVSTYDGLLDAIATARTTEQFSSNVILQQQVEGEELRFAVLNGKVISVIQRQPLRLTGDGMHTIQELIEAEDSARQQVNRQSLVQYPLVETVADMAAVDSGYVPAPNETIPLAPSTMISGGASVWNVMESVHQSYIDFIESVIDRLGAKFLVVDLFVADYRQAMNESTTYFNEFNKAPALKMFYSSRDGKNVDIVPTLAEAIEKSLARK